MEDKLSIELSKSIGLSALVMTETYPFFVVGTLEAVRNDLIVLKAEFGVSAALKGTLFHINLDAISALYAEKEPNTMPKAW